MIPRAFRGLVLATSVACIFLLYLFNTSTRISISRHHDSPLPRLNLTDFHRVEEEEYQRNLQRREAMVQLYGGSPENVNPWPRRDLYTLWDFFLPSYNCPFQQRRLGVLGDGGKWFCGLAELSTQRAPCVLYSFGINGESSFEAAVLSAAPQCEIWGYDFSVTSFGPEIERDPALAPRAHFFPYALGAYDEPDADPPMFTLQTLMRLNGHDFVDVLKVDVEGSEFGALASFVAHHANETETEHVLPIGQLQLEVHARNEGAATFSFPSFKRWWETLEWAGLRPFASEPNLVYSNHIRIEPSLAEYSFMNVRGRHMLTDHHY
ncbi:hypothetical protein BDW22DRAFT_1322300 [Trametopsis cervina]|nr:hypothetical protein BDW22DRAFT_1322300 [Trametopsis cervina]